MNGGSLGQRTSSTGSLRNGLHAYGTSGLVRKPSKTLLFGSREKEKFFPFICRFLCGKRVAMLLLGVLALLVFVYGSFTVNKENSSLNVRESIGTTGPYSGKPPSDSTQADQNLTVWDSVQGSQTNNLPWSPPPPPLINENANYPVHPCDNFAFPPPPPPSNRRLGPRACPVCYLPVEQAIASMPNSPSLSLVLSDLKYAKDENPIKEEPHGGSEFGGYPSLKQRNDSYNIKESMTVHCGFVKGLKPGHQSGFDIDESDLMELEQVHDVIVASAIFGNYDVIQMPENISEEARKTVPFYMFIDEETEMYMKKSSVLDDSKRVGIWRIIVVHNTPYSDARRNGKVPKLLLHRIFPNVRYSIWIDGKLQLVVDPYQILERFLWRQRATFAISRHYTRFDVFKEAEANKAAGKYDNASIDYQIEFYKKEGLTPYTRAKLPITSDVPEGCVIIKEHIPITNLFTCLWFNEVDRFTSRDQLSFSTVRDKVMEKVNWSINMFLDCERRNFVIQAYHRGVKPLYPQIPRVDPIVRYPPTLPIPVGRLPTKRTPTRRGRGERRPGSKRHRKVSNGSRNNPSF